MAQELSPNYYEILGIPPTASEAIIQKAYKIVALAKHPDKNASADVTAEFQLVGVAYETLCDAAKRQHYDTHIYPPVLKANLRLLPGLIPQGQVRRNKKAKANANANANADPTPTTTDGRRNIVAEVREKDTQ
ncbi:DnaJ domain-containing protein [Aspergillus multicolor]|uniref:J domain-containing protein n=1 Tax=Aspergillus multicolor TaxID=41759 RepID=UPI003CCCEB19